MMAIEASWKGIFI